MWARGAPRFGPWFVPWPPSSLMPIKALLGSSVGGGIQREKLCSLIFFVVVVVVVLLVLVLGLSH